MTKLSNAWKWAAALTALTLLLLAGRQAAAFIPAFADWVAGLGVTGALVFVGAYVLATVLLVPGSLLTLAAGALFGITRGVLLVITGATLGASAAFLIARYGAREWITRRLQHDPRFSAIDRAISQSGWKIVVLLRLSPLIPFNLLNYALGLTSVRFVEYLPACAAMLPGTLVFVYYGRVVGDVAALAAGDPIERGTMYYVFLAIGLLATVLATAMLNRLARRELKRSTTEVL